MRSVVTAASLLAVSGLTLAAEPATTEERLRALEQRVAAAAPARAGGEAAFNPAISLILDGKFTRLAREPDSYALPGFALGEETGPGERGLSLGESELIMSANIDNRFRGAFTAALTPENEVEIEEAYIETLALGAGATARAGRFFSHIGYLNNVHAHAWDFADQPLVYRAMLGNQLADDGVQLRWVAPTDVFLEFGAEAFRGEGYPAGGAARNGTGTRAAFVHLGGDLGASHAWRLGLSRLEADAAERATGDDTAPDLFTGRSTLTIVDFVWKWAPQGNTRERYLKLQAEHFKRDEHGSFDPASSGTPLDYRGTQRGWYAQAVYQFMPRWRLGVRRDQLTTDNGSSVAGTVLDNEGHDPRRTSVMVDFSNSEFSRLRLQFNRDQSRAAQTDNQWYLQYVMSLGAHGAHSF